MEVTYCTPWQTVLQVLIDMITLASKVDIGISGDVIQAEWVYERVWKLRACFVLALAHTSRGCDGAQKWNP